jgi:hypothetical protein
MEAESRSEKSAELVNSTVDVKQIPVTEKKGVLAWRGKSAAEPKASIPPLKPHALFAPVPIIVISQYVGSY